MKKFVFAAVLALIAAPAMAQDTSAARALILPMLQEISPGAAGEILADCVLQAATADELATLSAATGPSREVGTLITSIVSRPAALNCVNAAG
ncbi:hypothetical protein [Ketogulonicigenium vulgare]|uniref:Uncharacterized protein n=1 Tax=Ketogulonicigenium vulgare (strain WSH-001) TaxID=759362 RepID=F9Y7K8_KETVW|nr:hypothetical protein [Ketogulonicigenium vulgare]ADO41315.1 hypothetical protein EIO_0125 [Ketogulonicigenium vulgare Y25]AEM42304.1 hypothetical protein KVU_2466 [Ketogulonicigenium vulgare WSH-001]ALJ79921.1 hypothetical protein KVH_01165 [Ketogulonicigenium vulgare]ANW34837.1 hypothetical protein KvSKV_01170 [Ketogulonicigenium vulgare]AOZ53141.1 hypothetical protein KVC_0114 [Ketogulonicigenium vulgare]